MNVHIFRVDRVNHAVVSARSRVSRASQLRAVCAVQIPRDAQRRDVDIQCDACVVAVVAIADMADAHGN